MDEKEGEESTTAVLERVAPGLAWLPKVLRDRLTPAVLGSAVTALAIAIAFVVNAQADMRNAQRDIHQLNDTVAEQQKQLNVLHEINTKLVVMNVKIDTIANEVDRQREWRERIESAAELPPHVRRHYP